MVYVLAALIGVVAGMRTLSAPAAVSWAAWAGVIAPAGWMAFLTHPVSPGVFTALLLGELVTDKLPTTPSRKVPFQFGARLVSGAFAGAAIAGPAGAAAGVAGAVAGTLGGAAARGRMAAAFGRDWPAAVIEDVVAVAGAAAVVLALR